MKIEKQGDSKKFLAKFPHYHYSFCINPYFTTIRLYEGAVPIAGQCQEAVKLGTNHQG
jgi:hypothetical protein